MWSADGCCCIAGEDIPQHHGGASGRWDLQQRRRELAEAAEDGKP